jgi:hypothetical protein
MEADFGALVEKSVRGFLERDTKTNTKDITTIPHDPVIANPSPPK